MLKLKKSGGDVIPLCSHPSHCDDANACIYFNGYFNAYYEYYEMNLYYENDDHFPLKNDQSMDENKEWVQRILNTVSVLQHLFAAGSHDNEVTDSLDVSGGK